MSTFTQKTFVDSKWKRTIISEISSSENIHLKQPNHEQLLWENQAIFYKVLPKNYWATRTRLQTGRV